MKNPKTRKAHKKNLKNGEIMTSAEVAEPAKELEEQKLQEEEQKQQEQKLTEEQMLKKKFVQVLSILTVAYIVSQGHTNHNET